MNGKLSLEDAERDFFTLANRAVFANPFSDERAQIDRRIAGAAPRADMDQVVTAAQQAIRRRIEALRRRKGTDFRRYRGADRYLVRNVVLYDFFNRFIERFDQLIVAQAAAGEEPLPVDFAAEAFAHLHANGFQAPESCRYFETLYQLRRAFHFIDRNLVGRSPAMKELRRKLWNNVFTTDLEFYNDHLRERMEDFSTLILGETGTGKGTAAAAIGRSGYIPYDVRRGRFVESFTRAFTTLNLSEFSENLIESELFGHRKGAFTGAVEDYQGVLERCSPHGAILLDEIGEVSIPVQIKLLQVLQQREFRPVGGHRRRRFKGRVIAATNRPLAELRAAGRMRDDFYYRLCSDVIQVPPLRRRIAEEPEELADLLSVTVERLLGRASPAVAQRLRQTIEQRLGPDYGWPGNVRELEQCARRILLNGTYEAAPSGGDGDLSAELGAAMAQGRIDARGLVAGYCRLLYRRLGSYEAVARRVKLDRRTVKKHLQAAPPPGPQP